MDHQTELLALASLIGGLIVTIVATTWRSASLTTKLVVATERYEEDRRQLAEKTKELEKVGDHERRLGMLEKNFGEIPNVRERVIVLEQKAGFSAERRAIRERAGSQPRIVVVQAPPSPALPFEEDSEPED